MLLVVETAFAALSVALLDGEAIVAEHHVIVGRGHAETLMAAVAGIVGMRGSAVSAIAVDIGPGSFTGLRVGIAAARALGLAWGVPVTGFGSLALIAVAAFAADAAPAELTVAADAGRGQFYVQRFARAGCAALAPPEAVVRTMLPLNAIVAGVPRAADARLLPPALRAFPPLPLYLRAPDTAAA